RLRFSGPKTSIIRTPTTSLKTSIKTITNLSDTNCLEIQGASLKTYSPLSSEIPVVIGHYTLHGEPTPLSELIICTDFNAAKGDNPLVAYCCMVEDGYLSSQGFISSTGNSV
ncbi:hypothetical protein ABK732_29855, partial [Klebsiella michiganensis]